MPTFHFTMNRVCTVERAIFSHLKNFQKQIANSPITLRFLFMIIIKQNYFLVRATLDITKN